MSSKRVMTSLKKSILKKQKLEKKSTEESIMPILTEEQMSLIIQDVNQPIEDSRMHDASTQTDPECATEMIAPDTYSLGEGVYLRYTEWDSERRIDIRQMTDSLRFTKVGISLNINKFVNLTQSIETITSKMLEAYGGEQIDYDLHVGGGVFASVKSPFFGVSIRPKYYKYDKLLPSQFKGIHLKKQQWSELVKIIPTIKDKYADLSQAEPCHSPISHECEECWPFQIKGYLAKNVNVQ